MTTINGSIAISNINVTLSRWIARAHRASDGALVGSTNVTSNIYSSTPFSIDCGSETGLCIVTVAPNIGGRWSSDAVTSLEDMVIPSEGTIPYLYRATTAPGTPDPLDANVKFFAPLDTDLLDLKGHVATVVHPDTSIAAEKPTGTTDGTGSASFSSSLNTGLAFESSDFDQYNNDFTAEIWAKAINAGDWYATVLGYADPNNSNGWDIVWRGDRWIFQNWGSNVLVMTAPLNTWTHVAVTRQGNQVRGFLNGVVQNTVSFNYELQSSTPRLVVGRGYSTTWNRFNGLLARAKLTVGVARYWDAFTPSATTLPVVAKTGLTEPEWPNAAELTVEDGDIVWTCDGRMVQPISHGWAIPS